MSCPLILKKKIIKFTLGSGKEEMEDLLALEKEIVLKLNNTKIYYLSGTPSYLKELALGFLLTQGLVKDLTFLKNLKIKEDLEKTLVEIKLFKEQSKFDFSIEKSNFKISALKLLELFGEFVKSSKLFEITGCTHSAALADDNRLLFSVEDVRRHNAIDKVIGWAYLNGITLYDKMLFISSRISSEIVKKALKMGFPLIVSRGAPTSLAVKLADENDLTLIGFLREKRFNLYTHPQRIIF